jgi:hypothetical protein
MRDDDDDVPGDGAGGPLAEGLGETAEPGDFPSTGDEGTFGDGGDDITVDDTGAADETDADPGRGGDEDTTTGEGVEGDLLAESGSPLEGIGYLLDELHGALFGDEDDLAAQDEAVVAAFDADPADIETDRDLDLDGDGVVDLHEAQSPFDFGVDHAGG